MSFVLDLQKFREKTSLRAETVCRKVLLDLASDVVRGTPVDTGYARANWQVGISVAPSGEIKAFDKSGGQAVARELPKIQMFGPGKVAYLANNVPYIMALEYGHSKQAPAGMARIAVAKWQAIVDKAVREVR